MSAPTARVPGTSARAIGFVTVLGAVVLAAYEPTAVVGFVAGAALAATVSLSTGSHRDALPALLLPVGVLGALGAVALAVEVRLLSVLLTAVAIPIGVGFAVVLLGGGSSTQLEQVGEASLHAALVAGFATVGSLAVSATGGVVPAIEHYLLVFGPDASGLAGGFIVAGIALGLGLFLVPPAAFTTPIRRTRAVARRKALAVTVALGLSAVGFLAAALTATGSVGDWLAESLAVRLLLAASTILGLGLGAVSLLTRWSWYGESRARNPAAAIFLGTLCGFAVALTPLAAVGGPPGDAGWVTLFVAATILFAVGWLILSRYADALETDAAPRAPTVIALAFGVSGVAIGASVDLARGALAGSGVGGIASLTAIAAALFIYRTGQFGWTLGHEVGAAGSARQPQLVHAGWLGVVSLLGLVVAVGGLWIAAVFAPTLSVPATFGVLAGAVALVAGLWSLLN